MNPIFVDANGNVWQRQDDGSFKPAQTSPSQVLPGASPVFQVHRYDYTGDANGPTDSNWLN